METIRERVAYLRGMLDADPKLGEERLRTVFDKILAALDDIADELEALGSAHSELEDYVAEIDMDLAQLEDDFYDEDEGHGCCRGHEEDMVSMECPECGEEVEFEEGFLYDDDVQITCPNCGAVVFDSSELDEDELDEDDACECGDDEDKEE